MRLVRGMTIMLQPMEWQQRWIILIPFWSETSLFDIFSAEQVSLNIQAKDITVQEAVCGAQLLKTHLGSMRNEAKFDAFYSEVILDSINLTSEPALPCQRKRPRTLDDGASPHRYKTLKDRHRHMYFEVTELNAGEVEKRFIQNDLGIVNEIESILIKFANDNAENYLSRFRNVLK